MNLTHGNTRCIHADTMYNDPAVSCGRPTIRKTHGFYCMDHYYRQQNTIPARPRKPIQPYRGNFVRHQSDEQTIAEIIKVDTAMILTSDVTRQRFGSVDPVYLKTTFKHGRPLA